MVLVRKSCVVPTFLCFPPATITSCGRYPKVMRSWVFSSGAGQRARSPGRGGRGPVRRLGRRRWADSATDGRTGLGGPATPAKRPREPEAEGVRGQEEAQRGLLATWGRILGAAPGPRADRAASGLRLPPPASRGARARWPAQRRKLKGTVIATPRLLSSLGEGRRIPALNQLSDRGKIVELLICENTDNAVCVCLPRMTGSNEIIYSVNTYVMSAI